MPGWRLENTFFDWMHVVLLGVGRDAVAASIKLTVMRGEISWDTKRADLKMLTKWIKNEYKSKTGSLDFLKNVLLFSSSMWL